MGAFGDRMRREREMRGVTLEELRAFLSSILVRPAKSRTLIDWLRSFPKNQIKPGPAVITKTGVQP